MKFYGHIFLYSIGNDDLIGFVFNSCMCGIFCLVRMCFFVTSFDVYSLFVATSFVLGFVFV